MGTVRVPTPLGFFRWVQYVYRHHPVGGFKCQDNVCSVGYSTGTDTTRVSPMGTVWVPTPSGFLQWVQYVYRHHPWFERGGICKPSRQPVGDSAAADSAAMAGAGARGGARGAKKSTGALGQASWEPYPEETALCDLVRPRKRARTLTPAEPAFVEEAAVPMPGTPATSSSAAPAAPVSADAGAAAFAVNSEKSSSSLTLLLEQSFTLERQSLRRTLKTVRVH